MNSKKGSILKQKDQTGIIRSLQKAKTLITVICGFFSWHYDNDQLIITDRGCCIFLA